MGIKYRLSILGLHGQPLAASVVTVSGTGSAGPVVVAGKRPAPVTVAGTAKRVEVRGGTA